MKYAALLIITGLTGLLSAQEDTATHRVARYTLHMQETTVSQYRPAFAARYTGEHSQATAEEWATTLTSTIFAGLRLWPGAQLFVNPEIAGGSGLSSAYGIAAFSNGEAFRVGSPKPTIYMARAFFNQIIPLSSERQWQEDGENKIAQAVPKKYFSFTAGKISIADYFDNNRFSHNPRTQFLSWGLMSNGAWDYPANTRGYTPSVVLEYIDEKVELRYGISMLPTLANGNTMDKHVDKANASTFEVAYKYMLRGRAGKISALAFYNTAFMGSYTAPNLLALPDSADPSVMHNEYSIVASRKYGHSKYGAGVNLEQELTPNTGLFVRASWNDGQNETWAFTEIDRAISAGISINGKEWKRPDDVMGFAYCLSGLSPEHKNYLARGGLGFIIGDGQLNYASEHLFESYYSAALIKNCMTASVSYQYVLNPAYNKDRGPINIYSIRLHFNI